MSSLFDPQAFLDAQITEPTEKRPPLPEGDYTALIGEPKSRQWQSKDGAKSGVAIDIPLTIQVPPDMQSVQGRTEITLTDSRFLDLTDSGMLDLAPGKNSGMRIYREATDLNKAGDVFSWKKLTGCIVKVKVKHDLYNDQIQEKIGGVAKA